MGWTYLSLVLWACLVLGLLVRWVARRRPDEPRFYRLIKNDVHERVFYELQRRVGDGPWRTDTVYSTSTVARMRYNRLVEKEARRHGELGPGEQILDCSAPPVGDGAGGLSLVRVEEVEEVERHEY